MKESRKTDAVKNFAFICLIVFSLAFSGWERGVAKTWTVAKDGSGDYSVIQDALNVCAAGDTIFLMPGRYDSLRVHSYGGRGTLSAIMVPTVAPLTFIGAARDGVFLGPSVLTANDGVYPTRVMRPDGVQSGRIKMSNVTMENTRTLADISSPFTFSNCTFKGAVDSGVLLEGAPEVEIENCAFVGVQREGSMEGIETYSIAWNPRFRVTNCTFDDLNLAIGLRGCPEFELSQLTFRNVGLVLGMQTGSTGVFFDSKAGSDASQASRIIVQDNCQLTLDNVRLGPSYAGLVVDGQNATLEGTHVRLAGGSAATVWVASGATVRLRDSVILNTGGNSLVYHGYLGYGGSVDVRQCYWGTTDSLQVEQWISDGKDDSRFQTVVFWPIRETPVPAKAQSVGGLKALFHR